MPSDADLLADRRNMRRKLTLWRLLAVVGVIAVAVVAGLAWSGGMTGPTSQAHIARVTLSGFISGDRRTLDLLKSLEDSRAAAVLVRIDSPGGTVTGSEAIYDALRKLAAKKPTVAVVDGLAASGGYIAAMGSDRIVARQTSLVGSIGVLIQVPNVGQLLDHLGVKMESVKSSPLKAAPDGFEPTSPEARAALQRVVDDNYDWFKRLVRQRRNLADAEVAVVSDGRVHTGRQAAQLKLVDEIGSEPEAIAWLEREKGVAKNLNVRDWRRRSESSSYNLWSLAEAAARVSGMDGLATILARAADQPLGLRLDAPLALWQPAAENEADTIGYSGAMIKSELVQRIAERNTHLYQRDIENIVSAILDEIVKALGRGDRVELRGFGAFSRKARSARTGRNPRTGEAVEVEEKFVPVFKTGKELRLRLNGKA